MRLRWFGWHHPDYTWRDLLVYVQHLPPESAFGRQHQPLGGPAYVEHALALIADHAAAANWQRAGGKGSRPKPLPRPGDDENEQQQGVKHYGDAESALSLDDMADWLSWEVSSG